MQRAHIQTSAGVFTAWFTDQGLARLDFPGRGKDPQRDEERNGQPSFALDNGSTRRWHQLTAAALREALSGKQPTRMPPLDLSAGTRFQRRVWSALRKISTGETWTYSQVAAAAGRPRAVRAAGSACVANPIPVFVPCHRVVSKGGIGGFSSGLEWKRRLLSREGVVVDGAL